MKKICAFFAGFIILSIGAISFAAQFEDYKWGEAKAGALDMVKAKNKNIIKPAEAAAGDADSREPITYSDAIFDSPCEVSLYFHDQYGLYTVKIEWRKNEPSAEIKNKLLEVLSGKYGKYSFKSYEDAEQENYEWAEDRTKIILTALKNVIGKDALETTVAYYDIATTDKVNREDQTRKEEMEKKDTERF